MLFRSEIQKIGLQNTIGNLLLSLNHTLQEVNKSITILWDNTLTFHKTFADKHSVTAMIGSSIQTNTYEFAGGSIMGFVSPTAQKLSNGTLDPTVWGNGSDWALAFFM